MKNNLLIAIITISIIIVLVGGSFIGYLIYAKNGQNYIKYTEILPIIAVLVGLNAIIIGLFSVLGGIMLDKVFEERANKFIEEKARESKKISTIGTYVETAYIYYILSKKDPVPLKLTIEDKFLDLAIEESNAILKIKPDEYWECFTKNNLAFLHAIRDNLEYEDIDLAKKYSEFVFDRSHKYLYTDTEDAIEWRMTKAFVMAKHPENREQKKQAHKLYKSLLKLKGVTSEQTKKIEAHMENFWPS